MPLRNAFARVLLLASLAATGLVTTSSPAAADFHLMSIREVLPNGPAGADFVELQMYAPGQTQLAGHTLTVFDSAGNPNAVPLGNVSNGVNQATILIATPAFETQFGITPDFNSLSAAMTSASGAACFETIDCVKWGTFAFALPSDPGPAATAPSDGQSIERKITPGCATLLEAGDDTNDSATDFAVQPTPNPEPNSATPDEQPCGPGGGPGGDAYDVHGLKAKVKGGRTTITGTIQPPAPGDKVKLTFFANGSPLKKVAKKSATLNASSKFKKRFKVPSDSTRCKVKVAFKGAKLGQKKFRC